MNMTPEGEELLQKLRELHDVRVVRFDALQAAIKAEYDAEEAYAAWKVGMHGIQKGSIIEYMGYTSWRSAQPILLRARVLSWNTLSVGHRVWNGEREDVGFLEDMNELPCIYVEHALKSGGWSARSHPINNFSKAQVHVF